jgi:hypothetical protein
MTPSPLDGARADMVRFVPMRQSMAAGDTEENETSVASASAISWPVSLRPTRKTKPMNDAFLDALDAGLSKGPSDRSHYHEVVRSLSDDHLWALLVERGSAQEIRGAVAATGAPLYRRVSAGSADEKETDDADT